MRTIGFVVLVALIAACAASTMSQARERVSCTARHGCLFGKDARKPIVGWNCHSRHSHARSYYFCTPPA
jgi:hypothetical protein